MFSLIEDAGKKFAKGAKAEILESKKTSIDWEKVIRAGAAILELGIFAIAAFGGRKNSGETHMESHATIINIYR